MEHIVFLDREALRTDIRPPVFAHRWTEYATTPADQVSQRLAGATIVISNQVRLDRAVLTGPSAADLRLVAVCATGVDRVDLDAAGERGLCVTNVRSWCDESVAEHVVALMLALRRDVVGYHGAVVDGSWSRAPGYSLLREPLPIEVRGQVMGIIGFGSIGATVARLAGALGMEVLVAERRGASPRPGRVPFEELLARSDVVSLHCPLTPETAGLIGAAEFALMRPHALLINCARGGIVDEVALADALKTGRIGGAGLDCLAVEPPPEGTPLLAADRPNLIVTPHMAWASQQSLRAIAEQLIETIEAFVAGRPRNIVVDPRPIGDDELMDRALPEGGAIGKT